MNIRLNKNELAGALTALGKLVSRTSPIEAFRSVEIKGHNNAVTLRTAALNETICYRIPAETMEEFTSLVLFDDFRNAVRGCKTKELELEWNGTFLIVDDTVMPGVADTLSVPDSIPDNARCTPLPENFVELLGIAAPIVNRNDYRKALQGICLESEGIAVTNGKELLHIPVPLDTDKFTLPFPLVLIATKAQGAGIMFWAGKRNFMFACNDFAKKSFLHSNSPFLLRIVYCYPFKNINISVFTVFPAFPGMRFRKALFSHAQAFCLVYVYNTYTMKSQIDFVLIFIFFQDFQELRGGIRRLSG